MADINQRQPLDYRHIQYVTCFEHVTLGNSGVTVQNKKKTTPIDCACFTACVKPYMLKNI